MEIENLYKPNSNRSPVRAKPAVGFDYDLKSEKQEMEEVDRKVKNELLANWEKAFAKAEVFPVPIAAMHPEVVEFLLSFGSVSVYDNIAREANLDVKGRNLLPAIIWQIAQTKKWEDLDQVLEAQLPLVHSVHVAVANLLQQNIISKIGALGEKPALKKAVAVAETKKEIQLSLLEALSQYPKLGEQNVTINQLKLKYFDAPVRPSIKNWMTDFHDNMGAGKHGAIDRGNYLFHSENGKKLTPFERQKLSEIFKSLDEQTPLKIDTEMQTVIFESGAPSARSSSSSSPEAAEDVFQRFASRSPQVPARAYSPPNFAPQAPTQTNVEPRPQISSEDNYFGNFSSSPTRESKAGNSLGSPNFADLAGTVSFSSPQKLPVEQDADPVKNVPRPVEKPREAAAPKPQAVAEVLQKPAVTAPVKAISRPAIERSPSPVKPVVRQSQWHISPTGYRDEENGADKKDAQPKVSGNIVDLRN